MQTSCTESCLEREQRRHRTAASIFSCSLVDAASRWRSACGEQERARQSALPWRRGSRHPPGGSTLSRSSFAPSEISISGSGSGSSARASLIHDSQLSTSTCCREDQAAASGARRARRSTVPAALAGDSACGSLQTCATAPMRQRCIAARRTRRPQERATARSTSAAADAASLHRPNRRLSTFCRLPIITS